MRAAVLLLASCTVAGCATTGAVPSPFPTPTSTRTPPPSATGNEHSAGLVDTALSLRGSPYRDGGADPSGFDCSGFVAYVFGVKGQALPRTVSEQYQLGLKVSRASLEAGDLVFFSTTSAPGATHVGIAISEDDFIHAPTAAGVVRVESLASPYWASRFVGARRLP